MHVLLAQDDRCARSALLASLVAAGADVVADTGLGDEVLLGALVHEPDVVLLVLPTGGAARPLLAELRSQCPQGVVVLLCDGYADADLVAVLELGVRGCLVSGLTAAAVVASLRATWKGEVALPRRLVATVVAELQRRPPALGPPRSRSILLTPREREVLSLMRLGLGTTQIAERLFVSAVTVRTHAAAVQRKLGVHSREEAVAIGAASPVCVEAEVNAQASERPIRDRRTRTEHG